MGYRKGELRTVVITGASAGVGRATACHFAAEGAGVALIARNRERLEQTAAEVERAGGKAAVCPADVADPTAVDRAAARAESVLGPLDVWVNSAMVTVFSPFQQLTPEEFRRVTEVCYLGYVHGTMAALRHMQARDRGVIIQVGSALAHRAIPLQSAYCGAKHAIVGFTEALRSELFHDGSGIQLVMVHLPAINTPQFDWARNKLPRRPQPLPPIFQPELAAEAIRFAAARPSREIWLGRPTAQAILGQKIAPALLDRLLAKKAYTGQQTEEPAEHRQDNLFSPVEGPYGAHGRFDETARHPHLALQLVTHRRAIGAAGVFAALAGALGLALRRSAKRARSRNRR